MSELCLQLEHCGVEIDINLSGDSEEAVILCAQLIDTKLKEIDINGFNPIEKEV